MENLLTYFQKQVHCYPDKTAYLFLADGIHESATNSYYQLDQRARAIAALLQQQGLKKQARVALLYPAGIEFIAALLGCLYAGLIAVPLSYPAKNTISKAVFGLNAIIKHADISCILTLAEFDSFFADHIPALTQSMAEPIIYHTDKIEVNLASKFIENPMGTDLIACLQYTSGSTANPKGVIINHGNLIHSLQQSSLVWQFSSDSVNLTWTSHAHIYGLTTGLLLPLINGACCIIMPTMAYLFRPINWMRAISKYQVTHSGCPNFGYEICINELAEQELAGIELGSWKVAINGGEPIPVTTLERFYNKFKAYGFRYESFSPAYGMSEMTGLIATSPIGEAPHCYEQSATNQYQRVADGLTSANNPCLVSCGKPLPGNVISIINPDTGELVPNGKIGEVCVAGPSCTPGYWESEAIEKDCFILVKESNGHNKYLCTGDLGFMQNGEVVITGRLKELIIITGKNHYAFDIENTVANAHTSLTQNNIAFSLQQDNEEQLFILQEVELSDNDDYQNIIMAIRKAIADTHHIDTQGVLLTPIGTIPKTASGKKQRYLCKESYLSQNLNILYQDIKLPSS